MEQSRQNFAAASQLIVAGDPAKSRLLLHPLEQSAGGDPSHTGGKFWKSQDDPEWQALAAWVPHREACRWRAAAAAARPLDFDFFKARVQPMFTAKRTGLVRCTQCHTRGTGSGFALAPMAEGATTWTDEQARKNFESASGLVVPGEPDRQPAADASAGPQRRRRPVPRRRQALGVAGRCRMADAGRLGQGRHHDFAMMIAMPTGGFT